MTPMVGSPLAIFQPFLFQFQEYTLTPLLSLRKNLIFFLSLTSEAAIMGAMVAAVPSNCDPMPGPPGTALELNPELVCCICV